MVLEVNVKAGRALAVLAVGVIVLMATVGMVVVRLVPLSLEPMVFLVFRLGLGLILGFDQRVAVMAVAVPVVTVAAAAVEDHATIFSVFLAPALVQVRVVVVQRVAQVVVEATVARLVMGVAAHLAFFFGTLAQVPTA